MFVLCDCPITLAILDMEALRAGKEAIVQSASGMGNLPEGVSDPQDDWFFTRCYLLLLTGKGSRRPYNLGPVLLEWPFFLLHFPGEYP